MFRQKSSVKHKLIGVIVLSVVIALAVTYATLLAYEFHSFRQGTSRNLTVLAGIISENSSAALIFDDAKLAHENLAALRAEPEITAAALYDQHGKLYTTYLAALNKAPVPLSPGADGTEIQAGRLSLYFPVAQDKNRVGTLYLTSDLSEMYGRFRLYGMVLLVVLGGSLAVAAFLSSYFQRKISGPILELAAMARIVSGQKDYSVRVKSFSDDELGDLTTAFNEMLDRIQTSHSEVEQARDEAVKASHAKDDFIAALSHELRTPLSPVLLVASDGALRTDIPESIRNDFDTIRRNVELEARLIDDLLDITRIARGKLALDYRRVDLQAVLRDAVGTVKPDAEAKDIQLSLNPGLSRPVVRADPIRLQQIFWNILKNAVKFTPERGKIDVILREDSAAGRAIVTVEDDGIGLTVGEIPRLFQVFSQGDHADGSPHRFGGLGLGLAISRTLVELHSGSIRATSKGRGMGATFVIELPLAPALVDGPAPHPKVDGVSIKSTEPGIRILLVEDHVPTLNAVARILQNRGCHVLTAGSLAEARVQAARGPFDVLLSDIGLPDGNGCELMEELSVGRSFKGIALTGYGRDDDIARSHQAGFHEHLTKPVRVQMLDAALASVLKKEPP